MSNTTTTAPVTVGKFTYDQYLSCLGKDADIIKDAKEMLSEEEFILVAGVFAQLIEKGAAEDTPAGATILSKIYPALLDPAKGKRSPLGFDEEGNCVRPNATVFNRATRKKGVTLSQDKRELVYKYWAWAKMISELNIFDTAEEEEEETPETPTVGEAVKETLEQATPDVNDTDDAGNTDDDNGDALAYLQALDNPIALSIIEEHILPKVQSPTLEEMLSWVPQPEQAMLRAVIEYVQNQEQ